MTDHQLDAEAENIRENLWIFRLKRGLWSALFAHPFLSEDNYLDIETGKADMRARDARACRAL